ncbi:tRNA (adenosine(37)-N6)-dimethylallyltransferase MiaA [Glaciecola petra]|uniref:tRNA dimethylallyltransferase n=1 Tax=Glaciecola petra TaxID=3075602 RepID=A0ABU2ZUX8_9ALTE|nr:tRNA (adenosine(37)-N6)-dimethylallyltransferase MiaA [Aestuariibacter sp. P117]MDT0596195.1 tRNA (adenosine(37)-N6)-dimethylallyltransferase MiaA [Aestuariibacter sp. P117]
MGPTASGKTALAIELAQALNGEVISVDSALIYTHMDIGTAKPSIGEMQGVPHHLIDILSPQDTYSVADFLRDTEVCLQDILSRGKLPILAGGTMMYFNALVNGLNNLPAQDIKIRQSIQADIDDIGLINVHAKLAQVDPLTAAKIHPNDPQRTIRALEVYLSSGKNMSEWQSEQKSHANYNFVQFSIMPNDRSQLHEKIAQRFDQMLANGFIDEVQGLRKKFDLNEDLPSIRCVGYRQVWQHLEGMLNKDQMRERSIIATRQLAKRQITWLRNWQNIIEMESENDKNLALVIEKVSASA